MKTLKILAAVVLATGGLSAQAMPPQQTAVLQGEVLETRDVDTYTYLRLKTRDGEIWAAVPASAVKKGAQVTIGKATVMRDFESKTLNRKFDKIMFGEIVDPNAKPVAAPAAAPAAAAPIKVAKATGPDARTVAEVVKGRAGLKDKTVLVRGQVVKVNNGILGKNWLHLRDGTGEAADGSNDILVTTQDEAAVGDVVNARGTVRTDVDVGAGYSYPVLIEGAAVRK